MRVPDNYDMYIQHEAEQEREYGHTRCCNCDRIINNEMAYLIGDDWWCEECMDDCHHWVEED